MTHVTCRTTSNLLAMLFIAWSFGAPLHCAGADSWQPLMKHLPAHANALVMIHAEKVRASGFAKSAGWNLPGNVNGGLRSILPRSEIARCMFAARLNFASLAPRWEAGVLATKSDPTLEVFAAGIPGTRELLHNNPAMLLPFDSYLVKLAPSTFGLMGPADRQLAARWANEPAAQSLNSPYLLKIAAFPETVGTEIMLGLDLVAAVDPAALRAALADSAALREARIDPDIAAPIIASIEGVALGIRVLDEATGMIRVDFTRDPTPLQACLKPLLLERIAARGAMLEEFSGWSVQVQGKTAFLGGAFTSAGLSRVLSLVEPSLPGTPSSIAKPVSAAKSVDPSVAASQDHFNQVTELVTGIRFPTLNFKPEQFGIWIDKQARRIDELPVLNVDRDLLDYSQGVAKSLRVTAAKLRGASIRATTTERNTYLYGNYYGNGVGYGETTAAIQGRMEAASANLEHVDIMRMIDDETAKIRRALSERYKVEF